MSYDIVRDPAEFVFDATQQANVEHGTDLNFLRFSAATLKEDGITVGDYIGSTGDALSVLISDSPHALDGVDGAAGDCIFGSATGTFLADVAARGAAVDELIMVGASADANVFRDILHVVSDTQAIIETGSTVGLSTQTYFVGDDAGSLGGSTGVTDATVGTGATFTVVGGDFETSIAAAGAAPANTYIELSTGTYLVEQIISDTVIEYFSTAASVSLTGESFTVLLTQGTAADGTTGGLTDFVSISGDFTTLLDDASESINIITEADDIASVTDADNLVLTTGLAASGSDITYSAVTTTAALALSWDAAGEQIVIALARAVGLSVNTFTEVETAITSSLDPVYNLVVSDLIDATLTGTGSFSDADVGTVLQLDGGSDDEQLLLDADLLASATPTAQVYTSYKALRLDVSDLATNAILLDVTEDNRETLLGVASTDNPLSLGCFLALRNSPTRSIKAIGVSAVTATKPNGTLAAYTSAFSFLSGYDVYLINPLTQDLNVIQALDTHVTALSGPTEKSERIGFFSSAMPLYTAATVEASGTGGNSGTVVAANPAEFSASVDFEAQGVVAGDILVVTALGAVADSPDIVNGTSGPLYGVVVTGLKVGDPFVLEFDGTATGISANWNDLVDVAFSVYRPGSAITQAVDQAEVIAGVGEGFANRRMYHHWPSEWTAPIDGTEFILEGHYLAGAWAGKSNQVAARQGFSRTTVVGGTGVRYSNGYFSRSQLDRIAGGGTWISVQESQGAALRCRHQLSTDTSSVEKREFSITRIIDYTAKYLRNGLNKQVGQFNITQSYLDGLATAVQGILRSLIESGVLIDAQLSSIAQDDIEPDKVNIVIAIDVPFPANYIEVTLQV